MNRDTPAPFAAPPRFAKDGALLPITESAITAEKRILSYLRASAPKSLRMHATHALLDFSSNEESVWDESIDAESFFEGDQNSSTKSLTLVDGLTSSKASSPIK